MDYNIGTEKSRISGIGYIIKRWAIRATVMLLIVIIAGVSIVHFFSYSKYSLTEGIAYFSFEYPSRYYVEFTRLESSFREETMVRLLTRNKESTNEHDAEILVYVENIDSPRYLNYLNIDEEIEHHILGASSTVFRDFYLLERFDVEIAGVKGKGIIFSYSSRLESVGAGFRDVIQPAISRDIYFEYDEKIWFISVTACEGYAETVKADFEHVIETFKILE